MLSCHSAGCCPPPSTGEPDWTKSAAPPPEPAAGRERCPDTERDRDRGETEGGQRTTVESGVTGSEQCQRKTIKT